MLFQLVCYSFSRFCNNIRDLLFHAKRLYYKLRGPENKICYFTNVHIFTMFLLKAILTIVPEIKHNWYTHINTSGSPGPANVRGVYLQKLAPTFIYPFKCSWNTKSLNLNDVTIVHFYKINTQFHKLVTFLIYYSIAYNASKSQGLDAHREHISLVWFVLSFRLPRKTHDILLMSMNISNREYRPFMSLEERYQRIMFVM